MTQEDFTQAFGSIYEHSPWVAERAYSADLELTFGSVRKALAAAVDQSSIDEKLALLRAHPDLAGKLGRRGELTESSKSEQSGAGLDACTDEEFEKFQSLNTSYKDSFGFPFILAVKGLHRTSILNEFERRASNEREVEFAEALFQVHRIARFRLEEYFEKKQ